MIFLQIGLPNQVFLHKISIPKTDEIVMHDAP
jgi:hypothetical protein